MGKSGRWVGLWEPLHHQEPGPGKVGTRLDLLGRDPEDFINQQPKHDFKSPHPRPKYSSPAKESSDSKNKPQNLAYGEKPSTAEATQQLININTHQRPPAHSQEVLLPLRSQLNTRKTPVS